MNAFQFNLAHDFNILMWPKSNNMVSKTMTCMIFCQFCFCQSMGIKLNIHTHSHTHTTLKEVRACSAQVQVAPDSCLPAVGNRLPTVTKPICNHSENCIASTLRLGVLHLEVLVPGGAIDNDPSPCCVKAWCRGSCTSPG